LPYQITIERLNEYLTTKSFLPPEVAIYRELIRQAQAIAFNEAFWVLSVAMISMVLTVLFFRRPIYKNKGGGSDVIH
jgi:hypothetical protein